MDKKIYILVGPSGSGKTSLGGHLKRLGIPELVSHTTRDIRVNDGEIDGISYYFISKEEYEKIDKVEFSEYAGKAYCLSKKELEDKLAKHDMVFVITDFNGAKQIKKKYPKESYTIFISVTYDDMIERMFKRGDSKENIVKRISHAIMTDEMGNKFKCDFIVENQFFNDACLNLERIVKGEIEPLNKIRYKNICV